jgi:hypothetical protein
MNQWWKKSGLWALPATIPIALGTVCWAQQPPADDLWHYSRFERAVRSNHSNHIDAVRLSPDRSCAFATTRQGQTVLVALPNRPDLIQLLTHHRVDIFVQPPSDNPLSQGIASRVCGTEQPQSRTNWRYSQFVQAVQSQRAISTCNLNVQSQTVAHVRISADRSRAWVTTRDGQTVWVNLPNDSDLINLLTTHGVEISVLRFLC